MTPPTARARSARLFAGIAGLLASFMVALTAAPAVHAQPGYAAYLDLTPVNGDGSRGGGLNPALPLDVATLRAAVDQVRADGVAPRRYATLLHQYWLAVAAANADIDLTDWDPARGVAANSRTFTQVYVNYRRLATTHPEFYWAGLAELAGGSFASGFFDMNDVAAVVSVPGVHQLGSTVADLLRQTPAALLDPLPADPRLLATEGERLTAADLAWYQSRLMVMQRHIFLDQVPMHEAYVAEGLPAIEEMFRAGVLDENAVAAWRSIESGTEAGFVDALVRMTDREQNQIIADQWDATSWGRGAIGRVLTYVSTVAGKPAVPGVRAPGVFAPISVAADVDGRRLALRMPLPNFNWADRDSRWTYITGDLLPRYVELQSNRAAAQALLSVPFPEQLARGRLVVRLPELIADLTSQWQLTA
ncbi:hypothetical protein NDR87_12285 [Nocardia sp. CDC159]|uniref:Tat pathway signal protein n=1 Tax=Nocardia pulmonis TaxID=2951408 RepID=A0A9X2IYU1_9NOCA|nr:MULTISPECIES: hypothetical protein [Nocardia]MCM6774251.1 hypothetical protein [Nocardia pulmonis]MCM6787138.1 hypothetical protein [Nocardia sp. CDC159]